LVNNKEKKTMGSKSKFNFDHDWSATEKSIQEAAKGGFKKDERFWTAPKDEHGNYNSATLIRFLPDSNWTPFIKYYHHSFEYNDAKGGEKKKYFKNCVSTFGYDRECPICKQSNEYYKSAFEEDKKLSGERCRKLNYVANILVINDTSNPENNGKVFLFKFGKQIMNKIDKVWFPKAEDKAKAAALNKTLPEFNPFDFKKGANFELVTKPQGQGKLIYPSYEDSMFQTQSPVAGGKEEAMGAIFEQTVDLNEFLDEKLYPKNEEVIKIVGHILGEVPAANNASDDDVDIFGGDDIPDFTAPSTTTESITTLVAKEDEVWDTPETSTTELKMDTDVPDEDADDEAFFNQV
jgi:hypothetical protein